MIGGPHLQYGKSSKRDPLSILLVLTKHMFATTTILFLFIYFLVLQKPKGTSCSNTSHEMCKKTRPEICDFSTGEWMRDESATPLYNETCEFIQPDQNCRKNGRLDEEYLKWRWKPDQCELPKFDPLVFLSLLRGKKLLFVGDSLARNHEQSLLCTISQVEKPRLLYKRELQDLKWEFPSYNFTLGIFWSPFLVKYEVNSSVFFLHVDHPEEVWASKLAEYDVVVVSAGQWFFQPSVYYIGGTPVGRNEFLESSDLPDLKFTYGLRAAYETAFSILETSNFRGLAVVRTPSVSHFEYGRWNNGGTCDKRRPPEDQRKELSWTPNEMRKIQLEASSLTGRKYAKLRVADVTKSMFTRPDGHPGRYRDAPNTNISDCLHWCLPGVIDTWNQMILEILKQEL